MKVLICNERFLFRFGLDRVLILLAKGLADRGHEIYMMSAQWDEAVVGPITERFIAVPGPADYSQFNQFVADWLRREWDHLFTPSTRPDVVLIGGWPFFAAIEVLAEVCPAVVFVEPGAVPLDGLNEGGLAIQKILRDHRGTYLPKATAACPISQFLAEAQTVIDGVAPERIKTILLGADHMEQVLWHNQRLKATILPTTLKQKTKHWLQRRLRPQPPTALGRVERLLSNNKRLILNLGRWEDNCYKNSESCIELARQLNQDYPDVVLITLADSDKLVLPEDVRHNLVAIGFPDDQELQTIMQKVALGISVSLWEGFNLPLAEMQWIEQPALVFNIGAHPEVVVHPWFLCADKAEMLGKIRAVLDGNIPATVQPGYERWRSFFNWQRVVDEYEQYLQELLAKFPTAPRRRMGTELPLLLIDVTNSCRDPANSGVVRVTRQLSRQIQQRLDPLFVVWDFDRQEYVLPSPSGYQYLQQFNGPQIPTIVQNSLPAGSPPTLDLFLAQQPAMADRPKVFLFAETILDARCQASQDYVQQRGWESAAILYDLIPILYPEYCSNGVKSFFEGYLELMARVDHVIGISEFSAQCFRDYCDKNALTSGAVSAIMLPGEFGKHQRNTKPNPDLRCLKLLCVSTLEPRKNHRSLIEACAILSQQYPEVKWELTLVGNSYTGAPEIKRQIETLVAQDARVQWLGIVDDATLHQLYHETHITVYSSLVEGFGMPILESVWHGRPCLCHQAGVMAELAQQTPGCVSVDMTDPAAIANQIVYLAQNPERSQT